MVITFVVSYGNPNAISDLRVENTSSRIPDEAWISPAEEMTHRNPGIDKHIVALLYSGSAFQSQLSRGITGTRQLYICTSVSRMQHIPLSRGFRRGHQREPKMLAFIHEWFCSAWTGGLHHLTLFRLTRSSPLPSVPRKRKIIPGIVSSVSNDSGRAHAG